MSSLQERRAVLFVLAGAALLRIAFVLATPAWQAPDEYPHYWVAQEIARTGALPQSAPIFPEYEAFQPPFYYALASLIVSWLPSVALVSEQLVRPDAGLVALRLLSVIAGVLTVLFTWKASRGFPGLGAPGRLAAALTVACLPTFVGLSASVNNDILAVLFCSISLSAAMTGPMTMRSLAWMGLWAGLAILTKMSALVILPFLLYRVWSVLGRWTGDAIRGMLVLLAAALPGLVLLAARNVAQYGSLLAVNPGIAGAPDLSPGHVAHAVRNLSWSFWLAFGRTYAVTLPAGLFLVTALPLMLLAAAGWTRLWSGSRTVIISVLLLMLVAVAASLGYTLSYPSGVMTSWGKNLYPCLSVLVPLLVLGWQSVLPQRTFVIPLVAVALLLGGTFWGLAAVAALT